MNGKGDKPRLVNWDKYLENYQEINWRKPIKSSLVPAKAWLSDIVAVPTQSSPAPRNLVDEQPK